MRANEIEKLIYYKQQIIKDFIQNSIYPSQEEIKKALQKIDLKLSYFKTSLVTEGYCFNVEEYNNQVESIYRDLKLIYQLVKKFTSDQFVYLSNYAETELLELEKKSDFYLSKSQQETNSTFLGETLFFSKAPYSGKQENGLFVIDCGTLNLTSGSKISLILQGHDIEMAKMKLKDEKGFIYTLSPYSLNRDFFNVPGILNQTKTVVNVITNSAAPFPLPLKTETNKQYEILTGKNNVSIKTSYSSSYDDIKNIICTEQSMIDFYVNGSKGIRIYTSKAPLKTNFSFTEDFISLSEETQHFYLEMPSDSTVKIFLESGDLYAQKSKGIIKNNELLFSKATPFKEFTVIAKDKSNKKSFETTLEVLSTQEDIGLQSVLVKELV